MSVQTAHVSGQSCCTRATNHRCADCKARLHSICAALDPEELRELDSIAHPVSFDARKNLFVEGEPVAALYNVTAGAIRLYKLLPDGRRQIVGFALPGDFIGLSLADQYPFSADSIGEVEACRFSRSQFEQLVNAKPHLLRRLHEFATHELTIAQAHMTLLGRLTAEEKIANFLISMRDRWQPMNGSSDSFPLPMTRQDIADYLGLTIETVSRVFARLEREKKIANSPHAVTLTNTDSLEAIAAGLSTPA